MTLSNKQRQELDSYSDYPICPNCEHDLFVEGMKGRKNEFTCHNCEWISIGQ